MIFKSIKSTASKLNLDVEANGNSKNPLLFQDENLREVGNLHSRLPGKESYGIWRQDGSLQKVQKVWT